MKLAILADIHSNLAALNAVLEDAKRNDINRFVIAGDHVGDGPRPNEVVEKIRRLEGWMIKGNREEYTISYNDGFHRDWDNYDQMYAAVWTQKTLNSDNIDYLRNLPEQTVVNIHGTLPIRVVHGSPLSISELIYPNKHIERLNRAVNSINESVLICGHTHEAWSKVIDGKLVLNPGSVGVHMNDKLCSEYSILSWNKEQWNVEHRYVSYDINEVEKAFERTNLYNSGGKVWAKATMCNIKTGRNVMLDFLRYAYDFARKEGMGEQKLIPNELWNRAAELWNWNI